MPVIGLIGAIGAGKSLVASSLARRGAELLDADAIGHVLLQQRPARDEVVERFGPAILLPSAGPDGGSEVDRKALGAIVFGEPRALRDLEAILHPRMRRTFEKAIRRAARRGEAPAVVLDAAILLEAGWDDLCDRVVFVDAPRADRLARVEAHRGWDDARLTARERSQRPPEAKRARADLVLPNQGSLEDLEAAIEPFWASLRATSRPQRRSSAPSGKVPRSSSSP